jgi:F-type H+-transporting ATPase subunit delta
LAEEHKIADKIKQDIELVLQWIEDYNDLIEMLEHPIIKTSKKSEILDQIFKDQIGKYTLLFLHLIVKNKRENHLKYICNDFISLYKKNKGIKTALLTTSFDLTRTHQEKIRKSIEDIFKSPVELSSKVDETIVGGLIVQVDDQQLDLSVARQIQNLKEQFLEIDFTKKKI